MINDYIRSTMTVEEMVEAFRCWERDEEWMPSTERQAQAGLHLSKEVEQRRQNPCDHCRKGNRPVYHQHPSHCPEVQRAREKAWKHLRKPAPEPTSISSLDGKAYTAEDIRDMTMEDYARRRQAMLTASYAIPPAQFNPTFRYESYHQQPLDFPAIASIPSDDWACSECKSRVRGKYDEACDNCHRAEMADIAARMRG
jgi:hypothetical protein